VGINLDYLALLKGVSLFEKTPADKGYKEFVLDKRQVWENIDKITESDIKGTVLEFLKRWNIRNVNQIDSHSLEKTLKELSKYFGVLCNKSLINLDFNEIIDIEGQKKKVSEIIKEIYMRLTEVSGIGPTAASKIMHAIILQLFMMWDENIRNGYGYAGNAIGYLKFLRESQQILKRIIESYGKSPEDLCRVASPKINKTLTKLLDEFNYMKFTRKENLPNPVEEDC